MTPHEELTPQLQQAIADLRLSLTHMAESATPPRPRAVPARPWGWAFAATAAACTLLAAAAAMHHPHPSPAIDQPTQQEDDALLRDIDHDLTTPIAPSLSPLTPKNQALETPN